MVAELNGNAHGFKHGDGRATEVLCHAAGHVVEVAALVNGNRNAVGIEVLGLEEVELDLGMRVAREAHVRGFGEGALEHVPGVCGRRLAVGGQDVAEHPGGLLGFTTPREDLERGGVWLGKHVGFEHPGEALDGRTVETQAFFEGAFHFCRRKCHRFQGTDDVGKPQAYEAHITLFDSSQNELLLAVHGASFPGQRPCRGFGIRSRRQLSIHSTKHWPGLAAPPVRVTQRLQM
ncbi:conserved hypothetical protein [Arthrobacter sp. Hiyo1]|nr:conserved hypothetical protein [Arthrobacter sp. Hiyo1]